MPIDYKKYPPNWLTEIRPRIMKRANNTCEFEGCDFRHGEMVWSVKPKTEPIYWVREIIGLIPFMNWYKTKKVKIVITIAHLDHDESNHNVKDDRLKAACQLCHLRYDAKEKSKRRTNGRTGPSPGGDSASGL